MKYLISAGEASGDLHGSELITRLKEADSEAEFRFLGGDKMAAAAGVSPTVHYSQMAYMGFCDVIRHLPDVLANLKAARYELHAFRPDALIVIDYPSFNLKLAKTAHKLGIPVYYYIPPKVWAWKSWRVKTMRKIVKRVFSILPFEPAFYEQHGMTAEYYGNPSVEEIDEKIRNLPSREDLTRWNNLTSRPILAIVPGSREGELRNNLPVMDRVARRFPDYQAVVAAAPGLPLEIYRRYTTLPVVNELTLALMKHAEVALVTSGTATLECALIGTPQVACYRSNGSKMAYNLFKRVLHVKHVTLPNLIVNKAAIPEMLLHRCNPDDVAEALRRLLPGHSERNIQINEYQHIRAILGTSSPSKLAATKIVADLKQPS